MMTTEQTACADDAMVAERAARGATAAAAGGCARGRRGAREGPRRGARVRGPAVAGGGGGRHPPRRLKYSKLFKIAVTPHPGHGAEATRDGGQEPDGALRAASREDGSHPPALQLEEGMLTGRRITYAVMRVPLVISRSPLREIAKPFYVRLLFVGRMLIPTSIYLACGHRELVS